MGSLISVVLWPVSLKCLYFQGFGFWQSRSQALRAEKRRLQANEGFVRKGGFRGACEGFGFEFLADSSDLGGLQFVVILIIYNYVN